MSSAARRTAAAFALAIIVVAALALSACGGDDDEAPGFVAEADRICSDAARAELEAFASNVADGTVAPGYLEGVRDARKTAAEALGALEPPAAAADAYAELIAATQASVELVDRAIEASEDGDSEALDAARRESRELRAEGNDAAERAGLVACAGTLSDGDLAEITETLELTVDGADAQELCAERVTQAFLELRFAGKQSRCLAEQSDAATEPVEIEELFGVDATYANGIVVLDGDRFEVSLAFEDGVWKLNSVGAAA